MGRRSARPGGRRLRPCHRLLERASRQPAPARPRLPRRCEPPAPLRARPWPQPVRPSTPDRPPERQAALRPRRRGSVHRPPTRRRLRQGQGGRQARGPGGRPEAVCGARGARRDASGSAGSTNLEPALHPRSTATTADRRRLSTPCLPRPTGTLHKRSETFQEHRRGVESGARSHRVPLHCNPARRRDPCDLPNA